MKQRVGTITLEHLMRVKQLDIGEKTYVLRNQPELPAGHYEVWVEGENVEFVLLKPYMLDSEDREMLNRLLERSEHN